MGLASLYIVLVGVCVANFFFDWSLQESVVKKGTVCFDLYM